MRNRYLKKKQPHITEERDEYLTRMKISSLNLTCFSHKGSINKVFFAIHPPWAKLSDINSEGLFVFVHTCRCLSPRCKPHWGIAPTRHPTSETAVMDPIQSRSIAIQTRMSAVKTLSISCQVFARSLGCNEVLINNSWLSLIFNGNRLHDTLLDEEKRKRQIWRRSIIHIKDLFFVGGGETVRSWNQREESVDGGTGSHTTTVLLFFS